MVTVPEATKTIIERSRYLSEAISKGLINYSSLARYIKPELEQILQKKVSSSSIIMALNRMEGEFSPKFKQQNVFKTTPELSTHTGLVFCSLPNEDTAGLLMLISRDATSRSFYLKNQGLHETSIILSRDLFEKYKLIVESKKPIVKISDIAAITIYLPYEALEASGIYYFFLKSLAWEGINIFETVSTPHELTLIVDEKDTERTSSIIKSLFTDLKSI
jgi:hypothetical protein